ncbi:NAD-dependent epimerase/dehydratase family protein [Pseudohalocynthiibacter aestuariivivens]|jgi:UDP-glucuronate 4-epimerase|uniref:NAD-dependent epimerase/dehydratase family protein n=1 Tax=Pseudohalocynthiibacter aestuariivivens TaxID=1591409 RepID=A0ABV5JJJ6_9RHOB|nr:MULTISPECIES: NAD-dependent epimerase/dehydratase family protein [Pseudohalocynthiibacter]MBS9718260.1 NAD-dependent epimerase/dehydratase family protein [Pseudohalocynthiibacter aestuariivivens]MCK0103483.1 NAD-dependent epimerase/dehydratase family protein [Pseudohalocynthiibacter sp. F2068]
MAKYLVTGSAGFIGFHVCQRLLADGHDVIGFDSLSPYYDPALKKARHDILKQSNHFQEQIGSLETPRLLAMLFEEEKPEVVIHLAAQAGVRYSIDEPRSYVESNLVGTFELLEAARTHPPKHMLLASTSSAYGANTKMPYAETDKADHQMSFYAATKKATEGMAHSYAHLYGLPITMFRFFTVYGPWSRPDMAPLKFANLITEGQPIDIYNHGDMQRDFTFVDDLVEGIIRLVSAPPVRSDNAPDPGDSLSPVAPWRVINIGAGQPVNLMDFIDALETALGQTAEKNFLEMQPGDVPATWADAQLLEKLVGKLPQTPLETGVEQFVDWFKSYYKKP